jgi:hypothetical protein
MNYLIDLRVADDLPGDDGALTEAVSAASPLLIVLDGDIDEQKVARAVAEGLHDEWVGIPTVLGGLIPVAACKLRWDWTALTPDSLLI